MELRTWINNLSRRQHRELDRWLTANGHRYESLVAAQYKFKDLHPDYPSDEKIKTKIFKAAEGMKGYSNLRDILKVLVTNEGFEEVDTVVDEILMKLSNTEKGKGNPLASRVRDMRF